jgi:hypothetical protein
VYLRYNKDRRDKMKKSVALSLFILVSICAWADNTGNYNYISPQVNFEHINTPVFFDHNISSLANTSVPGYPPYASTFANDTYVNYNQTSLDKKQQSFSFYNNTYYTEPSQDKAVTVYSSNGSSYSTYTTNFPQDHSKDYTGE